MNIYKKLETAQEEEAVVDFVAMQSRDIQDKREISVSMSLLKQGLVRDNFGPDEEYGVVTELFDHHGQAVYQSTFTLDGQIQTNVPGLKPAQFRKDAPEKGRDFADAANEAAKLHIQRCELVEEFAKSQASNTKKSGKKKTLPYMLGALAIIAGIYAIAWFGGEMRLNEDASNRTSLAAPNQPEVKTNTQTAATGAVQQPVVKKVEPNQAAAVSAVEPKVETNTNSSSNVGIDTKNSTATVGTRGSVKQTTSSDQETIAAVAPASAADQAIIVNDVTDVDSQSGQAKTVIVGSDLAEEIEELSKQGVTSDVKASTNSGNRVQQVGVEEDASDTAGRPVAKIKPALDKSVEEKLNKILNVPTQKTAQ